MAASDYVPIFFKNRLHLAGRPQMSSRPSPDTCGALVTYLFRIRAKLLLVYARKSQGRPVS